jgi:hypothetical protein
MFVFGGMVNVVVVFLYIWNLCLLVILVMVRFTLLEIKIWW